MQETAFKMGNNKYVWEENNEILKRIVDEEQEELLRMIKEGMHE